MPSAKSNKAKVVCVTGANGFMGSWVTRSLLEKGYTIHASIFPGTETSHLKALPLASEETLVFFESDIMDKEGVAKAVQGCQGVFHLASPLPFGYSDDPESDLVRPAVEGTQIVLEVAKEAKTVKRVVITSSTCALIPNPAWSNSSPIDETFWTDIDLCRSNQVWYPLSKALAEKAAWKYAEENGLDIVTILPSHCVGPLLQSSLNTSCALFQQLLQGSPYDQESMWLGMVDVRDVATAQVLIFEAPSASGRYLCTNSICQFRDYAQTVSKVCPEFPIHKFTEETQPGMVEFKNVSKRLIDLGMAFTPMEETIRDVAESLQERGFLKNNAVESLSEKKGILIK